MVGATVTPLISKDGSAFSATGGTVTEISDGVYLFSGTNNDFNCDTFSLKFSATDAKDVFIHGKTESNYTKARANILTQLSRIVSNNRYT